MAHPFYPFVENEGTPAPAITTEQSTIKQPDNSLGEVRYAARIAVYDSNAAAPRVVVVEPQGIRTYLEDIVNTTNRLAREQGGSIPFMLIREVVENYIHAYFIEPTISIFNHGNTIRFTDQGPGIVDKQRALEVGTTTATEEMRTYIRGVGSGLPYVQESMKLIGGTITIEDNLSSGTVVTLSMNTAAVQGEVTQSQVGTQTPTNMQVNTVEKSIIEISDRGKIVLTYLSHHEQVGPTELVKEQGQSVATWQRELVSLEQRGLIHKSGQKRVLTEAGKIYLSENY